MPDDREEFRNMRDALTNRLRARLSAELNSVLRDGLGVATCITCVHFEEKKGELCGLAKARPPARVIASGCPAYMDYDEIPF